MTRLFSIVLLLSSLSFAQGMGGKSGIGGKAGFGGGASGGGPILVQSCNKNVSTSVTTTTIVIGGGAQCTSNVTAGNFVFMGAASDGLGSMTCTDTLSNTWTSVFDNTNDIIYCYSHITTGGADTVTLTWTNNGGMTLFSTEWSGTLATIDQEAGSVPASSTTWTLASITTTNAHDIVIGIAGTTAAATTCAAGSGYTIPANGTINASGQTGCIEYQIVTSAAAYQPTFTIGVAHAGKGLTTSIEY